MHVLVLLNFAAAVQGIFLTYLLAHSRHKSRESMLLGTLTLVLSVSLLGAVLGLSGYYRVLPHLIRVGDPFVLLYGPLVYLYVLSLIHRRIPRNFWLHGIPFLLYLISVIPFYSLSANEKIRFVDEIFLNNDLPAKVLFIQVLRLTHISVYIFFGYREVLNYERRIRDSFSDIEKISLDKAAQTLLLFLIGTLISIVIYVSEGFFSLNFVLTNNLIGLFLSLIIYLLAFSTWNKQSISEVSAIVDKEIGAIPEETVIKPKVRTTYFLTDEQYLTYSQLLEEVLGKDKLFLDNELTLATLSDRMNLQPYLVSELINRFGGEPFFDFINRYRISEVKRRLTDPAYNSFSILGIAFDCGFNSKSSFNTAFKKFTGKTPSEFRSRNVA
ncbi:MAG TPA: helix-turn-helix domain-containing protein [Prolixibacteraceae bacterium]|nr:helix-turn-helix domain-containing protein [Prolixibacteraceae bacterium]